MDMGVDGLAAAKELLAAGRWRSCVSRAYYAMYARTTHELSSLTEFSEGRDGPSHHDLPDMLFDYLTRLAAGDRWRFSTAAERLYLLRVLADYKPPYTVDEAVARQAVMTVDSYFKAMEAAYA
jgi:uncharacterized protein (UPF0332 family)